MCAPTTRTSDMKVTKNFHSTPTKPQLISNMKKIEKTFDITLILL